MHVVMPLESSRRCLETDDFGTSHVCLCNDPAIWATHKPNIGVSNCGQYYQSELIFHLNSTILICFSTVLTHYFFFDTDHSSRTLTTRRNDIGASSTMTLDQDRVLMEVFFSMVLVSVQDGYNTGTILSRDRNGNWF